MVTRIFDTPVLAVCFGAALLLFGRRLFWLLVAVSGFLAGMHLALGLVPENARLVIALVAGVIGAVLAVALQKFAIAFTGFITGGFLTMQALTLLSLRLEPVILWVVVFVGAVIGAVVLVTLFKWALIILSSVMGAGLLLNGAHLQRGIATGAMIALVLIGIGVQSRIFLTTNREAAE